MVCIPCKVLYKCSAFSALGMARVLKGSHSLTCTPRIHPLMDICGVCRGVHGVQGVCEHVIDDDDDVQ